VGGGVPSYLTKATPANTTPAVAALFASSANVTSIAQTDMFAYSIARKNSHYGNPNGAVISAIPSGSSSGPTSAVAPSQVIIRLGINTGSSLCVPASYQGFWDLRTTHSALSVDGLLPLTPSFDTVSWLTRKAWLIRAMATTSLNLGRYCPQQTVSLSSALTAQAQPSVRSAFNTAVSRLGNTGLVDDLVDLN